MSKEIQPLALLQDIFAAQGVETWQNTLEGVGNTPLLQCLCPVDAQGREVLLQVGAPEVGHRFLVVEFFSTLVTQAGEQTQALRQAAEEMNLRSASGGYGLVKEGGAVYHRHHVLLEKEMPTALARTLLEDNLAMLRWEIGRCLPTLWAIADGVEP